jgi:hypothetical protein
MSLTLSDADLARLQDCPGGIYLITLQGPGCDDLSERDGYGYAADVDFTPYVGRAKNIKARMMDHSRRLRNGKHMNFALRNAAKRYGVDGFEFHIVEFVSDKANQPSRERFWIDLYGSCGDLGFNKHRVRRV